MESFSAEFAWILDHAFASFTTPSLVRSLEAAYKRAGGDGVGIVRKSLITVLRRGSTALVRDAAAAALSLRDIEDSADRAAIREQLPRIKTPAIRSQLEASSPWRN